MNPNRTRRDAGTVVGAMESSNAIRAELAIAIGGVKAMPAVRALAKKLKVDLSRVSPSGAEGVITLADVKAAAACPAPALANADSGQRIAMTPCRAFRAHERSGNGSSCRRRPAMTRTNRSAACDAT